MSHTEILRKFKEIFRIKDETIDTWYPNGKNSVRVKLITYEDLIFTFISEDDWRVETLKSFFISAKKTASFMKGG